MFRVSMTCNVPEFAYQINRFNRTCFSIIQKVYFELFFLNYFFDGIRIVTQNIEIQKRIGARCDFDNLDAVIL